MGCKVIECKAHECKPMALSSMRQIHWIISGALSAGVRWKWVPFNPMEGAKPPQRPTPKPQPPSVEQAAQIVEAAWEQNADWGTLVWLVMVTGARRGEVLALQWLDLHLTTGILEIRRAYTHRGGNKLIKDTKTHQIRRISLDDETVQLLAEHRIRYDERMQELGITWFATCTVGQSTGAPCWWRSRRPRTPSPARCAASIPFAPLVGGWSASCDRERASPGRLARPPRFVRHKPRPLRGPNPIEYVARQDITVSLRPVPTAASGVVISDTAGSS